MDETNRFFVDRKPRTSDPNGGPADGASWAAKAMYSAGGQRAGNPRGYRRTLEIVHLIRKHSVGGLLRKVLTEVFRNCLWSRDTVRIYELPAGMIPLGIWQPSDAVDLRELDSDELRRISGSYAELAPAKWLDEGLQRFARGHRCWGLVSGGQTVSLVWSATNCQVPITEVGQTLTIGPDTVYFYAAGTLAECRGKGLYPCLLQRLCGLFAESRKLIGVHVRNRSSIRGIEKVGFQPCDLHYRVRVLGMRFNGRRPAV